jgi:hypothetical protein
MGRGRRGRTAPWATHRTTWRRSTASGSAMIGPGPWSSASMDGFSAAVKNPPAPRGNGGWPLARNSRHNYSGLCRVPGGVAPRRAKLAGGDRLLTYLLAVATGSARSKSSSHATWHPKRIGVEDTPGTGRPTTGIVPVVDRSVRCELPDCPVHPPCRHRISGRPAGWTDREPKPAPVSYCWRLPAGTKNIGRYR